MDNLLVENSASVVLVMGGETLVEGSTAPIYFSSWAMGNQYTSLNGKGGKATGFVNPASKKPQGLLDGTNRVFTRSRPQYADKGAGSFTIATAHGIANDGSGDQTDAINKLLSSSIGTPVFFPAGIYQVKGTVNVPVGSIIVGHGWSQVSTFSCLYLKMLQAVANANVGGMGRYEELVRISMTSLIRK